MYPSALMGLFKIQSDKLELYKFGTLLYTIYMGEKQQGTKFISLLDLNSVTCLVFPL